MLLPNTTTSTIEKNYKTQVESRTKCLCNLNSCSSYRVNFDTENNLTMVAWKDNKKQISRLGLGLKMDPSSSSSSCHLHQVPMKAQEWSLKTKKNSSLGLGPFWIRAQAWDLADLTKLLLVSKVAQWKKPSEITKEEKKSRAQAWTPTAIIEFLHKFGDGV